MGLLDDAIREHLELKRRHGGDPGEIERQEREALGELPQQEAEPATAEPVAEQPVADEVEAPAGEEELPRAGHEAEAPGYDEDPWLDEEEPEAEEAGEADARPETQPEPPTAEHPAPEPPPAAEGEEDVLEETPEFLQETPEHDRLWFEQKPPRDFDWDR